MVQVRESLGRIKCVTEAHDTSCLPGDPANKSSAPFRSGFPCTGRWCRQSDRRDTLPGKIGPQVFQLLHRGYSAFGRSLQTAACQSAREVELCHRVQHGSELTGISRDPPSLMAHLHCHALQLPWLDSKPEGHVESQTCSSLLNIHQVIKANLNSSTV